MPTAGLYSKIPMARNFKHAIIGHLMKILCDPKQLRSSRSRNLPAVLCLVFIGLSLLAGCSKGVQDESNFDWSVFLKSHPYDLINIDWERWGFNSINVDKAWFQKEIEGMLNVAIVPIRIEREFIENPRQISKLTELPDIWSPISGVYSLYENGIIRGIPIKMIQAAMPEYSRLVAEKYPEKWKMLHPSPDREGEVLGIKGYSETLGLLSSTAFAVRKDWAEQIGYYFDEYDEQKIKIHPHLPIYWINHDFTIEEFENLLVSFLNGNINKAFSFTVIPYDGHAFNGNGIEGCFGLTVGPVIEDRRLTMGQISESYYDYVSLMQKWFQLGLYREDISAYNTERNYYKVAVHPVTLLTVGEPQFDKSPPNNLLTAEDIEAGAEVVVFPPPIGPKGDRAWISAFVEDALQNSSAPGFCISRSVDDEKLFRILQVLEYVNFGNEQTPILAEFGKPGVHFDWEGEPWESQPMRRKAEDIPDNYPQFGGFGIQLTWRLTTSRPVWSYPPHLRDLLLDQNLSQKIERERPKPAKIDYYNDPELSQIKTDLVQKLRRHKREFFNNVVYKDLDIEEEWPRYVSDWLSSGGQGLLEAFKKIP